MAQDLEGEDWPAAAAKADALWRGRGAQRDPLALVPIAARLRALDIHVGEHVAAALVAVEHGEHGEIDPMGTENRPHLTTTNELLIANVTFHSRLQCYAKVGFSAPETGLARDRSGCRLHCTAAHFDQMRRAAAGFGAN